MPLNSKPLTKEISYIKKGLWCFFLLVWVGRFWQGLLLHQLQNAPFVSVEADNVFWLWHGLGFVEYSIQYFVLGLSLDLLWLGIVLLGILEKEKRWLVAIFCLVFTNYFICYNSVATHHEHTLVALLLLQVLFLIKNEKTFVLAFAACRYYVLFVMLSAALWKLGRGSLLVENQMVNILKVQHFDYLTSYPESLYSNFIYYLIQHPLLSNLLWYGGWCLEFLFVVGFFTKRYDKALGILFLGFFVADYLLMDLCFAEFCIFALVFYPFKEIWSNYYQLE